MQNPDRNRKQKLYLNYIQFIWLINVQNNKHCDRLMWTMDMFSTILFRKEIKHTPCSMYLVKHNYDVVDDKTDS